MSLHPLLRQDKKGGGGGGGGGGQQLPVRVIAAQPECGRHAADCLIKLVKMNGAPRIQTGEKVEQYNMSQQNLTPKCD